MARPVRKSKRVRALLGVAARWTVLGTASPRQSDEPPEMGGRV